jgi:hypothetical protein
MGGLRQEACRGDGTRQFLRSTARQCGAEDGFLAPRSVARFLDTKFLSMLGDFGYALNWPFPVP